MIILCALLVLAWAAVLGDAVFTAARVFERPSHPPAGDSLPFVSILIALRNEAPHVQTLCENLRQLNYPTSRYEILFGDDCSTDQTAACLAQHKPAHARIISIPPSQGKHLGKQNVLAQLTKQSQGAYLLFTDADMALNPDWILGMLGAWGGKTQMVVGMTNVKDTGLWARMQNLDWLTNEYYIAAWHAQRGTPLTAWGNNMMVEKAFFQRTGGYDAMPPSLVEDATLMQQMTAAGASLQFVFRPQTLATTQPIVGFRPLLHQRKRWMQGIQKPPMSPLIGFLLKLAWLPASMYLMSQDPLWAMGPCVIFVFMHRLTARLGRVTADRIPPTTLCCFLAYDFLLSLLLLLIYLLPLRVRWKGRVYDRPFFNQA